MSRSRLSACDAPFLMESNAKISATMADGNMYAGNSVIAESHGHFFNCVYIFNVAFFINLNVLFKFKTALIIILL